MQTLKNIFIPFKWINKNTVIMLVSAEIVCALIIWQTTGGGLIPTPFRVAQALMKIIQSETFIFSLTSSAVLTLKGMFMSIVISMILGYLSRIQFFKYIVSFIVKCRYLTLTGLIFLFTLITKDGHQLKISLLIFGIVPFFVTSLLSTFDRIDQQEFDLCKTLKMNNFEILWELLIVGRIDQVFEVMRQNFAISWMMITMVEGLSMSEGGLGTMLLKANKYVDLSSVFAILVIILTIGILFDFLLFHLRVWLFPYIKRQKNN